MAIWIVNGVGTRTRVDAIKKLVSLIGYNYKPPTQKGTLLLRPGVSFLQMLGVYTLKIRIIIFLFKYCTRFYARYQ